VQGHQRDVLQIEVASLAVLADLDTPEDYAQLKAAWESRRGQP
jgi:hypothetical protein